MKKKEITSRNLQRLAGEAGIGLKALKKLYRAKDGNLSPDTVNQHWTGFRAIGFNAMDKYIEIFKMFNIDVNYQDFFK